MTHMLTLDSTVSGPDCAVAGIDVLRRWEREGKIGLVEADRAQPVALNPEPVVQRNSDSRSSFSRWAKRKPSKMAESGNATFASVAAVLYPGRDPLKLSISDINSVVHLIRHHHMKHEIYITSNSKGLIDGGRRARLKTAFGILAMTPEEAVTTLRQMYGWEEKTSATVER